MSKTAAERSREYRARMSPEKKAEVAEKSKLYQRELRARTVKTEEQYAREAARARARWADPEYRTKQNELRRKKLEENPELRAKVRETAKQTWRRIRTNGARLDKVRRQRRLRSYNITAMEFERLWLAQESKCGICAKKLDRESRTAHVDHCHNTGKVRGLLCQACNTALGKLGDSLAGLTKAMQYLAAAEGKTLRLSFEDEPSNDIGRQD